jgi:hypothetical protein
MTTFRDLNEDVYDLIRNLLTNPQDKYNLRRVVGKQSLSDLTYIMNLTDDSPYVSQVDPTSRRAVFSVANTIEYCYNCFIHQYKNVKEQHDDKILNKLKRKTLKSKAYTIWLLDIDQKYSERKPESIIEFKMITNDQTNVDDCHFTIKTNMSGDPNKPLWVENIHCILLNDNQEDLSVTLNIENLKSTDQLDIPKYKNGTQILVKWRIDVFRFAAIYFTRFLSQSSWFDNFMHKEDPKKPSSMKLLLSILKRKRIEPYSGLSYYVCDRDLKNVYNAYLQHYIHRPDTELHPPSPPSPPSTQKADLEFYRQEQIRKTVFICRAQLMMALNDAKNLKDLIILPKWQLKFKYYTNILRGLCDDDLHFPKILDTIITKLDDNNKKMDSDVNQSEKDLSTDITKLDGFIKAEETNITYGQYEVLSDIAEILRTSLTQSETKRKNINDNVQLIKLHRTIQVAYNMLQTESFTDFTFQTIMDTLSHLIDDVVPKYIDMLNEIRQWAAIEVDNLDFFKGSLRQILYHLTNLKMLASGQVPIEP